MQGGKKALQCIEDEDMRRKVNALDDIATFILCNTWRLEKDNGEPSLMSLELGAIPIYLDEDLSITLLMLHKGFCMHVLMQLFKNLRSLSLACTCRLEGYAKVVF